MRATDSVVLLHDGPRLWLVPEDDGTMRAFRRPLPADFRLGDPAYDWETVFRFLPYEISMLVRGCATIALVPASSTGRPARVFAFEAELRTRCRPRTARSGRSSRRDWDARGSTRRRAAWPTRRPSSRSTPSPSSG
ncbi:hypothetical protein ACVU7I_17005 [Patulibacter sp. S7RM1-6]